MAREAQFIESTAGQVAAELARRGILPQAHVTVVIDEDLGSIVRSPQNMSGETGVALIKAIQSSPYRDISLEPPRSSMPVREVLL